MANLCDWYVEARIKMEHSRINYLNSIQPDRTIAEPLLSEWSEGIHSPRSVYINNMLMKILIIDEKHGGKAYFSQAEVKQHTEELRLASHPDRE